MSEFFIAVFGFLLFIAVGMLLIGLPAIYYHISDALWIRRRRKEVQRFGKTLKIGDRYLSTYPPFKTIIVMSVDERDVVYKFERGTELCCLSLDYFYDHFIKLQQ